MNSGRLLNLCVGQYSNVDNERTRWISRPLGEAVCKNDHNFCGPIPICLLPFNLTLLFLGKFLSKQFKELFFSGSLTTNLWMRNGIRVVWRPFSFPFSKGFAPWTIYQRVMGLILQDMALSIYCDNYAKFLRNGENEHLSLSLSLWSSVFNYLQLNNP